MITITAAEACPGDVVLDAAGTAWQRGRAHYNWSTFTGPVGYFGPWEDSYGPAGELTLLARGGKTALLSVPDHVPPG